MTLPERLRAHPSWGRYCLERKHDSYLAPATAAVIAADLELTQAERFRMPQIAGRSAQRGRPPKPARRVRCPHCHHTHEV